MGQGALRGTVLDLPPRMPGEVVDSGFDHLELVESADVLVEFVSDILPRSDGLNDEPFDELKDNLRAIRRVDAEEAHDCVAAWLMGVDPHDPLQMRSELA